MIDYSLKYSSRKTLGIKVSPNGDVEVTAPIDATLAQIEEKLHKKASWIQKQQRYFQSFGERTPQKQYKSGESHFYLGRQCILKISEGKDDSAKYNGRCFEVVCSPKTKAEELMKEWYRERSKVKFLEIVESVATMFAKYGVSYKGLYIQNMNNRWGSCTPSGRIILNGELIKAPKPCIIYVVTHEFCHLLHRDHTKAFYDLLEREMPDWKRWKDKLERFMMYA